MRLPAACQPASQHLRAAPQRRAWLFAPLSLPPHRPTRPHPPTQPITTPPAGSTIKQGERHCVVYATGMQTFFGRAAALLGSANQVRQPACLPACLPASLPASLPAHLPTCGFGPRQGPAACSCGGGRGSSRPRLAALLLLSFFRCRPAGWMPSLTSLSAPLPPLRRCCGFRRRPTSRR